MRGYDPRRYLNAQLSALGRALAIEGRRDPDQREDDPPPPQPRLNGNGRLLLFLAGLVVALASYAFSDLKGEFRAHKRDVTQQIDAIKETLVDRNGQDARDRRLLRAIAKQLKVPEEEETR